MSLFKTRVGGDLKTPLKMLLNVAQPVVGENGAVKEISSSRCEGQVGLWHSADPQRHRDGVIDRTFDLPPPGALDFHLFSGF